MDIFAFLLVFVLLYRVGFHTQEDEKNYLSVGNCVSLRGACALAVMGHHISQWISQSVPSGFLFHYVFDNAGYLAVSVISSCPATDCRKAICPGTVITESFCRFAARRLSSPMSVQGCFTTLPYTGITAS